MSEESRPEQDVPELKQSVTGLIRNYISFVGLVIMFTSLACILLLFLIDLTRGTENPYFGIVTYILLPSVLIFGIVVVFVGMVHERRRRRRSPTSQLPRFSSEPVVRFRKA